MSEYYCRLTLNQNVHQATCYGHIVRSVGDTLDEFINVCSYATVYCLSIRP